MQGLHVYQYRLLERSEIADLLSEHINTVLRYCYALPYDRSVSSQYGWQMLSTDLEGQWPVGLMSGTVEADLLCQ